MSSFSKPTIVVDLDDTLVYITEILPKDIDSNSYFTITFRRKKYYVQMRPNLQFFLEKLSNIFDIYVFTTLESCFANKIIDKILPNVKSCCRFFKDSCAYFVGYFIKDLKIINRPLSKTLMIDYSAGSAIKNPKNLIKIKPWNGEKDDNVLNGLIKIFESIDFDEDIRQSFIEIIKKDIFDGIETFPFI